MKRFLISSITVLVAIGFFASCASNKETMTTVSTESAPAKKETTAKKSSNTEAAPSPSPAH